MNKKLELTPRLRAVASLVPQGMRLADIGTDHAYLPVWLLLQGRIPFALACDLRKGPLERARTTAEFYGQAKHMDFRLCDGLSAVTPDEVDAVVIAGMGGETISDILAAAPWVREAAPTLILQPMSTQPELRRWLWRNGFEISREINILEGKTLYTIMTAEPGCPSSFTPAEEWVGRQHKGMDAPLRARLLDNQLGRIQRALDGMALARGEHPPADRLYLEQVRDGLLTMKEEWRKWQI